MFICNGTAWSPSTEQTSTSFCFRMQNTLSAGLDDGNVPPNSLQLPTSFRSRHRGKAMLLYISQRKYCYCGNPHQGQHPWLLHCDTVSLLPGGPFTQVAGVRLSGLPSSAWLSQQWQHSNRKGCECANGVSNGTKGQITDWQRWCLLYF